MNLDENGPGIPAKLRNSSITGKDRERLLVIDSGEVSISGKNKNREGKRHRYDLSGEFWGEKDAPEGTYLGSHGPFTVNLAKLQTDSDGRLKVIPADGHSASVIPDNQIVDFTKNDAWYDDWCDGTVTASVKVKGVGKMEASPAWGDYK